MSGFANSTRPTIFWWTPIAPIGLRFATQADFFCELRPAQNTRKNQKMLEHSTSTEINCPNFSNSCVIISSKSSVWKPLPLGRERKHRSFLNYRFPLKGCELFFRHRPVGDSFQWAASLSETVTTHLIDLTRCCERKQVMTLAGSLLS